MSKILCIIDGMNDPAFDVGKYPALSSFPIREYAKTVPNGFEAETLPCVLTLLGITSLPKNIRGWIEALGAGIQTNPEDLIFRGSWVELNRDGICVGFCNAPDNIPVLSQLRYFSLGGYKSLLIIPGYASYVDSIMTPMPFDMIGKNIHELPCPNIPELLDALDILGNIDSSRAIIPWMASVKKPLPHFHEKAAVVSGTNVIQGIAIALNMHHVSLEGMTGDTNTNLNAKAQTALKLTKEYHLVILHIGGCDEAAHRMNRVEKESFLSRVDEIVLTELLASDHDIEVVSDHGVDPATGRHIGGLQPAFRLYK